MIPAAIQVLYPTLKGYLPEPKFEKGQRGLKREKLHQLKLKKKKMGMSVCYYIKVYIQVAVVNNNTKRGY